MNTLEDMPKRIIFLALALPLSLALAASCSPGVGNDDAGTDAAAVETCNVFDDCEGELTCCDGFCVDTEADPDHCGACGNDCSEEGAFCSTGATCVALDFASLCENTNLLALYDGITPDDETTDVLRDEVAARCGRTVSSGNTSDRSLVDAEGVPQFGVGTTVVLGGGGFFQPLVEHVENTGVTPIFTDQINGGSLARMIRRGDGAVLASVPSTTTGEGEDWFTVYLVEEPTRGALVLAAYGFTLNGTRAAGVWARDAIFADLDGVSDTWWAVRWEDSDGTSGPSVGDTFEVVASGR